MTLTSAPGSAQPSVVKARISSSSSLIRVTAPFSVMPQAETILTPSVLRACSTSGPGIGAPAHRKVLRLGTPLPVSDNARVRSARKGVDAIVKVTPSWRMSSVAFAGSQTSCRRTLARSMIGIIRPYMKPVWWAKGEAMRTISFFPSLRRSA